MRGFFSLAIAALVAFGIAAVAAHVSSSQFAGEGRVAELDARIASERVGDAGRFVNATLLDALLDAAYAKCGCGVSPLAPADIFSNYSSRSAAYVSASARNLSTPLVTVNAMVSLASFSVSSCNAAFESNATAAIAVNSTHSKKTAAANYSFQVQLYRDTNEFNATTAGLAVRVRCA